MSDNVRSNGVCRTWCSTAPTFRSPEPTGVSLAGSMFRVDYVTRRCVVVSVCRLSTPVTSRSSTRAVRAVSPLTRSSFAALDVPYVIVGTGDDESKFDNVNFGV
jgi:hypothetical protein